MWKGVTQDEEDVEDGGGFKMKTPVWRSPELSNLVKVLDERRENTLRSLGKQPLRKVRNFGLSNE